MNCLEWLPIYFGILKTGAHGGADEFPLLPAMRSPTALDLADVRSAGIRPGVYRPARSHGPGQSAQGRQAAASSVAGPRRPAYADDYRPGDLMLLQRDRSAVRADGTRMTRPFTSPPAPPASPKPSYISTRSLLAGLPDGAAPPRPDPRTMHSCCIPPLYHTGAKMHWFGSLVSGSKAVLLRGVKPEWISPDGNRGKMYHCVVAGALVSGPFGGH